MVDSCTAANSSRNAFFFAAAFSSHSNFSFSNLFSAGGASSSKICRKHELPYLLISDLAWLTFFFLASLIAERTALSRAWILCCSSKDKRFLRFLPLLGSMILLDTGQQSHEFTR